MQVSEIMSSPVYALRADDSVFHARSEMVSRGVSKFPVVEDGDRIVGMLTKSDIVFAGSVHSNPDRRGTLQQQYVGDICTRRVYDAPPGEPVERLVQEMASRNVSGVPVVNGSSLQGIITESDVLRHVTQDLKGSHRVRDLMTPDPVTVHAQTTLKSAIETMREKEVHQLPVMENAGTLAGILTMSDIIFSRWFDPDPPDAQRIVQKRRNAPGRKDREKRVKGLAGEAMTDAPTTVAEDRDVSDATHFLVQEGFNTLPVLDDDGHLTGIVTRTDLIRAWAGYD